MCGTFANSVETHAPATVVITGRPNRAQCLSFRWGEGAEASYVHMSHEQARAIQARMNALFPPVASIEPLDAAYRAVDALGGRFDESDPHEVGYDEALGLAMAEIAKLGGMDPRDRARLAALSAQPSEHLVAA